MSIYQCKETNNYLKKEYSLKYIYKVVYNFVFLLLAFCICLEQYIIIANKMLLNSSFLIFEITKRKFSR